MAACSEGPLEGPPQPHQSPQPLSINRGGMGYLTPDEANDMQYLAWPQTYADMKGTFGVANRSTRTADIYRVAGSNKEVWVFYDGTTATGFEIK